MADNQPAQTPAPEPVAPQTPAPEPGQQPAEGTPPAAPTPNVTPATPPAPVAPVDPTTLTDEHKTYLKGQGIDEKDVTPAIFKLVNHAVTAQKSAAEKDAELKRIKESINPTQAINPFGGGQPPVAQPSATPAPVDPNAQPQQPQGQAPVVDQTQAYLVAGQLATQYPKVAEDLQNGKFYQDMQAMQIPLVTNGQLNLAGIQAFAKQRSDFIEMQEKITAAPGEDAIPPVNPQTPAQPADDATMTKQMAQNIVLQGGATHARYAEATQFLQSNS